MIRHIVSSIAYASYVKISIAEFSTNRIDHANWVGYPWATRVGLDAPWFAALRNSGEPTGTPVEMLEFIVAILLLVLGGLAAVLLSARPQAAQAAGQIGAIAGSALGLFVSIRALVTGEVEGMSGAWPMPGGGLHLEIDALSSFFLLPVFGLSVVTGLYGRSYLAAGDNGARWPPVPPGMGDPGACPVLPRHLRRSAGKCAARRLDLPGGDAFG